MEMTKKEEKKSEYSVVLPQNYVVNIRVGNNPYEEEFEVKTTLHWIELYIRAKYWDNVEVNSIRLIREPKLKISYTETNQIY